MFRSFQDMKRNWLENTALTNAQSKFFFIFALLVFFLPIASKAQLPGQIESAVIHASNYESLQSALNAIPTNGGIVRLPPGKFEIQEPLEPGR